MTKNHTSSACHIPTSSKQLFKPLNPILLASVKISLISHATGSYIIFCVLRENDVVRKYNTIINNSNYLILEKEDSGHFSTCRGPGDEFLQ